MIIYSCLFEIKMTRSILIKRTLLCKQQSVQEPNEPVADTLYYSHLCNEVRKSLFNAASMFMPDVL